MKKIITVALLALLLTQVVFLAACGGQSYKDIKWVYDDVASVKINEELDADYLAELLEDYDVASVADLEAAVLNLLKTEETYKTFTLRFSGKNAMPFDFILNREVIYFFKEIDGEVVLAHTELQFEGDDTATTLHPSICPRFVAAQDLASAQYTVSYAFYFVTLNCVPAK